MKEQSYRDVAGSRDKVGGEAQAGVNYESNKASEVQL
jgi:hypothetical protein